MLPLLALSSLVTSSPEPLRRYCELAPGYGQAGSEEGRFDSRNSIGGACGYRIFAEGTWNVWASLVGKELNGSLYQPEQSGLNVRDFQTRSLGFGLALEHPYSDRVSFGLGIDNFWGQGSLKQTFSMGNLRQTLRFSELKSREWQMALNASYKIHQDLAFVASLGLGQEQWSWNPDQGSFLGESVSSEKRLSLTSNPATWQGSPVTGALRSQVRELKLAIRLYF